LELTGLIAKDLIASSGNCLSVSWIQVGAAEVAFDVFQTPPLTVPTKITSAELGLGTMALIAPPAGFIGGSPVLDVMSIGPGPCSVQFLAWAKACVPPDRTPIARATIADLRAGMRSLPNKA
jgi:hypothetical protein